MNKKFTKAVAIALAVLMALSVGSAAIFALVQ